MAEQMTRLNGVVPYLTIRGAADAIEFYTRAFAAEELGRMPDEDGRRLIHAYVRINDADVFMSDEYPEHGFGLGDGPKGVVLHLPVDDADAWWARALEAGCTIAMPIADQFWGERYGQLRDPFGHTWSVSSPIKQ